MSNQKVKPLVVALIVGGLALWAFMRYRDEVQLDADQDSVYEVPVKLENTNNDISPEVSAPAEVAPNIESKDDEAALVDPIVKNAQEAEIMQRAFLSQIKIKMNFPPNLNYQELDLDGGVACLYGTSPTNDQHFAVLASRKRPGVAGAVEYLNEYRGAFPMLKGESYTFSDKVQKFKTPPGSGLGELTLIPGGESNGRAVYMAYVERADKQGAYLFIMEDKVERFREREEHFEDLFDGLKAEP